MSPKDTEDNAHNDSPPAKGVNRREFLRRLGITGGGIVVFSPFGPKASWAQRRRTLSRSGFLSANVPTDFNAFLRISVDNRVTCLTGKVEMGQGVITSLPQMLAEELDVPYESVDIILGDTDLCPWDAGTFGSLTTPYFGTFLREAAAEAKGVLKELAAERFNCPVSQVETKDGTIFNKKNPSAKATYGELTQGKIIERHLDEIPLLKKPDQFTIVGTPRLSRDVEDKVTGRAKYAGDIRLPGMLYARILRPPAHGARLKSADTTEAEKIKGVKVIRDRRLIAVLHEFPDVAEEALEKVRAEYDLPEPAVDNTSIFKHLEKSAPSGEVFKAKGSLEAGRKLSAKNFKAAYLNHYVAHAPMETHTAVVQIKGNKATAWVSTQTPFWAKRDVARALRFPSENVRVITPFLGGGFGGKTSNQQAVEAARLAKLTGRPVQVAWSRKEEFFYDNFRPAAVIKVESGLDLSNRIAYWDYDNYFAGTRSSQPVYDIPHLRVMFRGGWMRAGRAHPFRVGAWRGPGSNTNVFAMESQVDLMAEAAGLDPLEFRLKNLKDKRMRRVLLAVSEKFGHSFAKAPSEKGYGLACSDYHGTYVAAAAQVSVDKKTGRVQAERVVLAQDMGQIINPAGAEAQIEGCITMGLGYCFTEEIRFKGGQVLDENFDTYKIPRFSWLPKIETVLIDNPTMDPQGCGEPPITVMGAVMANAVYDAIGVRLFELPMTPARVKKALG